MSRRWHAGWGLTLFDLRAIGQSTTSTPAQPISLQLQYLKTESDWAVWANFIIKLIMINDLCRDYSETYFHPYCQVRRWELASCIPRTLELRVRRRGWRRRRGWQRSVRRWKPKTSEVRGGFQEEQGEAGPQGGEQDPQARNWGAGGDCRSPGGNSGDHR